MLAAKEVVGAAMLAEGAMLAAGAVLVERAMLAANEVVEAASRRFPPPSDVRRTEGRPGAVAVTAATMDREAACRAAEVKAEETTRRLRRCWWCQR